MPGGSRGRRKRHSGRPRCLVPRCSSVRRGWKRVWGDMRWLQLGPLEPRGALPVRGLWWRRGATGERGASVAPTAVTCVPVWCELRKAFPSALSWDSCLLCGSRWWWRRHSPACVTCVRLIGGRRRWSRAAVSAARACLCWPSVAVVVSMSGRVQRPWGLMSVTAVVDIDRRGGSRRPHRWSWRACAVAAVAAQLGVCAWRWRHVG